MKRLQRQKGFTLVELAIVLTIIGLLIGGILKGQQLMQNARITSTMAQIQAIDAATTTFRDTYNAMPGDMPSPNTRLTGFLGQTGASGGNGAFGDGIVGRNNWDLGVATGFGSVTVQGNTAVPAVGTPTTTVDNETVWFWAELSAAQLLAGITYSDGSALAAGAASYGTTNPAARIGGGWIVGSVSGTSQPLTAAVTCATAGHSCLSGTVLVLAPSPVAVLVSTTGLNLLTPTQAAQMDRKMDDGNPLTGFVQGFGTATALAAPGCMTSAAPFVYQESFNIKDCGLIFRIQG